MRHGLLSRRLTAMTAAAAITVGAAASTTAAQAASSPAPGACPSDASLSQPFAAWGDTNEYRLVPGGDFAGAAPGWTLTGGASVVAGGDPFALTGSPSVGSLSLPAGATAQSPFTCVDATQPTFRFVDAAAAPASSVLVSVVYQEPVIGTATLPVGTLLAGGAWQPSPQYQNGEIAGAVLTGGTAEMALRFTALTGSSRLDDVFVDPRMGGG